MPVKKVIPSGYCLGVVKAINTVRKLAENNPGKPVYVLGMLVHNRFVVEALEKIGVKTLSDPSLTRKQLIDTVNEGIIVFSAHGIADEIVDYAKSKGLETVDASCPFVLNNRHLVEEYLDKGYEVLYIGKKNHPEADAVLSLGPSVHLITGTHCINELAISNEKIFVTNQTTMSIHDIASTMKEIQNRYPSAVLAPEVCDATRMRQQAVLDLKNTDVLVVVGDPTSNNTSQLASIGSASGITEIYKIETAQELPVLNIDRTKNIAVTAGASTPRCLTDSVIHYLETGDEKLLIPDISKMLD